MITFSERDLARLKGQVKSDAVAYLTHQTGGVIDWHNVGGLFAHRAQAGVFNALHRYSAQELMIRGSIIALALAGGIAGFKLAGNAESASLFLNVMTKTLGAVIGSAIGGVAAHEVAVRPTINRRKAMLQQTVDLAAAITSSVEAVRDSGVKQGFVAAVKKFISEIQDKALPNNKRGDLATNIALKLKLMRALDAHVNCIISKNESTLDAALLESTATLNKGLEAFVTARLENSEANATMVMSSASA